MTVKQKQCLLAYLGYYNGDIDGKWGNASKEATKAFQKASGLTADGSFGAKTEEAILRAVYAGEMAETPTGGSGDGNFWNDIDYFKRTEFKCQCGGKYCNGYPAEMEEKLIRVADRLRKHFGMPVTVSSGVRCTQHNANVGGVYNSKHLYGKAMDFSVRGKSASEVLEYVRKQPEIAYCYAINGSYVHMNI